MAASSWGFVAAFRREFDEPDGRSDCRRRAIGVWGGDVAVELAIEDRRELDGVVIGVVPRSPNGLYAEGGGVAVEAADETLRETAGLGVATTLPSRGSGGCLRDADGAGSVTDLSPGNLVVVAGGRLLPCGVGVVG